MPLAPGTQIGPYAIVAQLGAPGGMDEIYEATDTRLDRTVAIKVLCVESVSVRQGEHEDVVARAGAELRRQADEARKGSLGAGTHGDILPSVDAIGDRKARDRRTEVNLPQHPPPRLVVQGSEPPVHIAAEHESAPGRDE